MQRRLRWLEPVILHEPQVVWRVCTITAKSLDRALPCPTRGGVTQVDTRAHGDATRRLTAKGLAQVNSQPVLRQQAHRLRRRARQGIPAGET